MELLYLGAIGFWAIVAIAALIILACVENVRPGWATFVFVVATALLSWLTVGANVPAWIRANPGLTALIVLGYFAAGTIWSVIKWTSYVFGARRQYDEAKTKFLSEHGESGTVIPQELRRAWRDSLYNHHYYHRKVIVTAAPSVSDNKARIVTWIAYWPWSLLWTLIDDPVKRFCDWIYRQIRDSLEAISRRAFRGVEDDMKDPPGSPAQNPADAGRRLIDVWAPQSPTVSQDKSDSNTNGGGLVQ